MLKQMPCHRHCRLHHSVKLAQVGVGVVASRSDDGSIHDTSLGLAEARKHVSVAAGSAFGKVQLEAFRLSLQLWRLRAALAPLLAPLLAIFLPALLLRVLQMASHRRCPAARMLLQMPSHCHRRLHCSVKLAQVGVGLGYHRSKNGTSGPVLSFNVPVARGGRVLRRKV